MTTRQLAPMCCPCLGGLCSQGETFNCSGTPEMFHRLSCIIPAHWTDGCTVSVGYQVCCDVVIEQGGASRGSGVAREHLSVLKPVPTDEVTSTPALFCSRVDGRNTCSNSASHPKV